MSFAALAAVVLAFVPVGKAPGVILEQGFITPSRNIACNAGKLDGGGRGIDCVVYSASPKSAQKVWFMRTSGRAGFGLIVGDAATDVPTLRYGKTWRWRGIRCTSARTGLTCTNASGHGFALSRERQRIF